MKYLRFPSCRHCGKQRLEWAWLNGRWQLVNPKSKKPHRCDPVRVTEKIIADFADLT